MKLFRLAVLAGLLVCLAPLASLVVAGSIASHYGCTLHEGFANPCVIGGVDRGQTLYTMAMMGWMMLFTMPLGAALLALWVIVEVVRFVRARRTAA